jgi:1,4-dihydroxy-6-naphthoate synthase
LWEKRFSLPLPLGGIAVRRDQKIPLLTQILKESYLYAQKKPERMYDFILSKSIEKRREIVDKHIDTYVNADGFELSLRGREAIKTFLAFGAKLGYYPPCETSAFCDT